MDYIEGGDLASFLEEQPARRIPVEGVTKMLKGVAEALDYAHSLDPPVIHRDLKPENLLLDKKDGRVKITDFGLAREVHDSLSMLGRKELVSGTPTYMPYEQYMGDKPHPTMDVYSLGIIVYEMLAGEPPFCRVDVIAQHEKKPPPVIDDVPENVMETVLKALAKKPEDRFSKPSEFISELETPPLPVCPVCGEAKEVERFKCERCGKEEICVEHREEGKYCGECLAINEIGSKKLEDPKKHEVEGISEEVIETIGGRDQNLPTCPICGATGYKEWFSCGRCGKENICAKHRDDEWHCPSCAEEVAKERKQKRIEEYINNGDDALEDYQWSEAKELYQKAVNEGNDDEILRSKILECEVQTKEGERLQKMADSFQLVHTFEGHKESVNSLIFSPDGKTIASGSKDKTIKIWDVSIGTLKRTLKGHQESVNSIRISPDNRTIATGSEDKTIKIWEIDTGMLKRTLKGHNSNINSICYSPDGTKIVSGGDNVIKIWDAASGKLIHTLEEHYRGVNSVSFSPDGSTIASGLDEGKIIIWDAVNGRALYTIQEVEKKQSIYLGSAFAPKKLLTQNVIFNSEGSNILYTKKYFYESSSPVKPDSLMKSLRDNTCYINIWNIVNETIVDSISCRCYQIISMCLSPDSNLITMIIESEKFKYPLEPWRNVRTYGSFDVSEYEHSLVIINASSGKILKTLDKEPGRSVSTTPDGRIIASASADNKVNIWKMN